ncbi:hypothetical protein ACDX78_03995 [Virgibacillus oceani]
MLYFIMLHDKMYISNKAYKRGINLNIIIIIISYILLSTAGSVAYVGILLSFFMVVKRIFNMDESKWNSFFKYKKGSGLYFAMVFPYLVTLIIMFPLSVFWFDLIHFEYRISGSIFIISLLALTGLFKFPKLKGMLQNKYQATY